MTLVAESPYVATQAPSPRGALPLSFIAHGIVLAIVLWAFHPAPSEDQTQLESIAVSIITTQTASDDTAVNQSDASQTLVAAGAVMPGTAEPVEPLQPTEATIPPRKPITADAVPVEAEPAGDIVAPLAAATMADAEAEEATAANNPSDVVEAIEAEDAVQPAGVMSARATAAAAMPSMQPAQPAPPSLAATEPAPAVAIAEPVQTAAVEPIKPAPKAEPTKVEPAKPKPSTKPKPQAQQKPQASSGAGGKSDANAQASAATRGGAGKLDAGGSAAESKYPGLIQARLKRVLRFPSGANFGGEAHVRFLVHVDGSVSDIEVVKSAGSEVLDTAAQATVRRAAPFPPIPAAAGRNSWSFTMPLRFR